MRRTASAAIVALLVTAGLIAQAKTNFTGKWTQSDPDPSAPGGRGRAPAGGWGLAPTITQDATTLTVDYNTGPPTPAQAKFVIKLDGSESKNSTPRGIQSIETVSKAAWQDNKLVVTTTQNLNGSPFETKRILSLEGGNLVIETSFTNPLTGTATTNKVTYKKAG